MTAIEKAVVFLLSFFSYALFHASRKSFSSIKAEIVKQSWLNSSLYTSEEQSEMCGLIDTLFLLFYAFGLYFSGIIGDRFNLKYVITIGMTMSATFAFLFGLGGFMEIHSLSYFAILWALNGLVQSSGWPANIAVMANWFKHSERGAILGIWSGNASFGNILGTAIVALFLNIQGLMFGWQISMMIIATLLFCHSILVYRFLIPVPLDQNKDQNKDQGKDCLIKCEKETDTILHPISFFAAWTIPGVIPYATSYACLKSVNYALFFWLPFFLTNELNMSDSRANYFSMLYDVGQIFGGFAGGYISDRLGVRSPVVAMMTLIACYIIQYLQAPSLSLVGFLLTASGFFMGGPAVLISSAISADLGTHPSLLGNERALATVTGIIDGTGSVGAAGAQYLIGYLTDCHLEPHNCKVGIDKECKTICSWNSVFSLFTIGTISSVLCLLPLLRKEIKWNCIKKIVSI